MTAYAFRNVTVVTMEGTEVLPHRTVIVREGIIASIDGPEAVVPAGVHVIDGTGRFLMPGLVDMHVHLCDEGDLSQFLRYGVTSVRTMGENRGMARLFGYPDIRRLRDSIRSGSRRGPTIYAAGEVLDGRSPVSPLFTAVTDVRKAERLVRETVEQGYEYVKVYDKLEPEVFEAIVRAARSAGIRAVGHVPKLVGIDGALDSGLHSIEHLTGYIDNDRGGFVISEDRIDEYAVRTRASGVWNCPTLTVYDNLVPPADVASILSRPEARFVGANVRFLWKKTLQQVYRADGGGPGYAAHMREVSRRMTRALHKAGARLVAGTDTNFVGVFPGASLHRELLDLAAAGLSPAEALLCATRNAAECLGRLAEFGTVTVGKRADLLLLNANPLEDLAAVGASAGVMVRGTWLAAPATVDSIR